MGLSVIIMLIEALLCNVMLQPTADTDVGAIEMVLLVINIFVLVFSVFRSIGDKDDEQTIKYMIIASLLLRLAIMFWDINCREIFILPNSEADAVGYKDAARSYAFYSRSGQYDYDEYSFYIGQMYKLIGMQETTAQYLNVYFAVFSIVLIYKILTLFQVSVQNKKKAIALACFLPNSMMIMSFFLQESVIAFCIILSLYFYTKWWFTRKIVYFIVSFIPSIFGAFLHSGSIVPVIAIVATFAFVGNVEHKLKITVLAVIGAVIISVVVFMFISSNSGSLFAKIGGSLSAENVVNSAGKTDRVSDADYFIGVGGLPPVLDLIVNSPIRMLYFLASPVPWMWRGLNDIAAFFGSSIFYIIAFWNAVKLIRYRNGIDRDSGMWAYFFVLFIMIIFATFMFGWGVSNSGTALRHREKFTYIFIIIYIFTKEMIERTREVKNEESVSDSSRLQRREVSA
jgi:hypothetical protein